MANWPQLTAVYMAYWPHLYLALLIILLWGAEKLFPKFIATAEESLLVLVITSIMVVSFGQVVARYGFNTGWAAALEFSTIMFSWLILLGMSYGVKTGIHLGVDILLNAVPRPLCKFLALIGALTGVLYGLILLDSAWLAALGVDVRGGAIEYWAKFFKVGIGVEEVRYPVFIQELFGIQDRVHKWLVLIILPISLALLVFRSLQAFVAILKGDREMLISGHEAKDLIEENKNVLKD